MLPNWFVTSFTKLTWKLCYWTDQHFMWLDWTRTGWIMIFVFEQTSYITEINTKLCLWTKNNLCFWTGQQAEQQVMLLNWTSSQQAMLLNRTRSYVPGLNNKLPFWTSQQALLLDQTTSFVTGPNNKLCYWNELQTCY